MAQVGRVPLLLLDSYVEDNEPALREVTDRLYGGGGDHQLRQELLLGPDTKDETKLRLAIMSNVPDTRSWLSRTSQHSAGP